MRLIDTGKPAHSALLTAPTKASLGLRSTPPVEDFGHGVVTMRRERLAAQNPPDREPATPQAAKPLDSLVSVFGTGGLKATTRCRIGRDIAPIYAN
jgi:hypothetical protein